MNKEFFARKKDIDELQINKANASDVYTKEEVINKITEKITEIVADAPEDFNTLKEMSDWINNHEDSAAAMNTTINTNKTDIVNIQTTLSSKIDKEEGKSLVSDSEIARLANVENYDDTQIKNGITLNRTTLGVQCKNLLKNNAVTQTINGVTFTVNDDKSVTLNGTSTAHADFYLSGAWGSTSEILQKNKYIASIGVSQSSTFNGVVMHCINNTTSIGSPSCNYPSLAVNSAITAVYISVSKGYTFSNYKLYPMIRYADILDDTYEPYQPSLQEQTPYSLSVSGKSTSAAISYNGVPTLICLTPNTADSTAGGLYMINSAGAVVKLIEKTDVVVAANTANNTFTITNNTTTVMDVCISRCWGR